MPEHFEAIGQPQRRKAIARNMALHGVTLGALAFTGVAPMKEPFGPPPIDVTHVSNTNAFRAPDADDPDAFCARLINEIREAIEAAGADEVALIIVEPVQNAGGCLVAPPGYWQGAARAGRRVRGAAPALVRDGANHTFDRAARYSTRSSTGCATC